MKILHIGHMVFSRVNGLRYSVPNSVSNQNKIPNMEAMLLDINMNNNEKSEEVNNFDFKYINSDNYTKEIEKYKPDIVVFQGYWTFKYIWIARYLKRKNIPYVIVPRSSLTKKSFNQKKIKKKIFSELFYNKFS